MNILVLDIETTGFLQANGKIVEIGAVDLNLETGEIKEVFNEIVLDKDLTILELKNSWIIKNSDLSLKDFENAKPILQVLNDFQKLVDSYQIGATAYNNTFDFSFLEHYRIKFGVKLGCPMKLSTPICQIPSKNGYAGYKWPSVEEAYHFFFPEKKDFVEAHRGLDDAKHEAEIIFELYKREIFKV